MASNGLQGHDLVPDFLSYFSCTYFSHLPHFNHNVFFFIKQSFLSPDIPSAWCTVLGLLASFYLTYFRSNVTCTDTIYSHCKCHQFPEIPKDCNLFSVISLDDTVFKWVE